MNKSESIKNIAVALVKFNGEISKIAKDAKNPQFRSAYVTLDALIDGTKHLLQSHGLVVMQFPLTRENGEIGVQTLLLHDSGEYIESEPLFMTPTRMIKGGEFETAKDPQAAGSTISYIRRYSYQAILNLNTGEDDDGNKATPSSQTSSTSQPSANTQGEKPLSEKQMTRLYAIAATKGVTNEVVVKNIAKKYNTVPTSMSKQQYDEFVKGLEAMEIKK